jgi:flagellar basal-body rod modification protein FlgD
MQTSLANLSSALQSAQMLSGASLVGHQILTAADASNYSGAGTVDGMVEVPAGAARVQLTVTDSSGQAVRHIELSAAEGAQRFSWDGKSDTGAALAAGHYKIQVLSGDAQTNESLQTYITGRVSSVSLDAGGAGLTVNTQELGSIGLNAVREVI